MTEKEKVQQGLLYNPNRDEELQNDMDNAKRELYGYNNLPPWEKEKRADFLRNFLGKIGENGVIHSPLYCDYGYNVEIGNNFFANMNLVILDGAKVTIGDNVFVAPNVGIYTAGHPLEVEPRNEGVEYAYPVTIGNNVWIGAHVAILPGVTIGDNSVIGAGSIVSRDIPSGVLAVGNPCRVIRKIREDDRKLV